MNVYESYDLINQRVFAMKYIRPLVWVRRLDSIGNEEMCARSGTEGTLTEGITVVLVCRENGGSQWSVIMENEGGSNSQEWEK